MLKKAGCVVLTYSESSVLFWLSCDGVASSLSRQSRDQFAFVEFGFDFAVEAGCKSLSRMVRNRGPGLNPMALRSAPVEDSKSILMPDPLLCCPDPLLCCLKFALICLKWR